MKVEPVGYAPAIARLKAGAPVLDVSSGSPKMNSESAGLTTGLARMDGSKVGAEPSALSTVAAAGSGLSCRRNPVPTWIVVA